MEIKYVNLKINSNNKFNNSNSKIYKKFRINKNNKIKTNNNNLHLNNKLNNKFKNYN